MKELLKLSDYYELYSKRYGLWLRISSDALNKAFQICIQAKDLETGGALIGYYSKQKSTCIVEEFLGPTSDSKHFKYNFESGFEGLKGILGKFWQKKKFYIGDWHFHPKSSPLPSGQDVHQLHSISRNSQFQCKNPLMVIIGQDHDQYNFSCIVSLGGEELIEFISSNTDQRVILPFKDKKV